MSTLRASKTIRPKDSKTCVEETVELTIKQNLGGLVDITTYGVRTFATGRVHEATHAVTIHADDLAAFVDNLK